MEEEHEVAEFGSNNCDGSMFDARRHRTTASGQSKPAGDLTGLSAILHWRFLEVEIEQWCAEHIDAPLGNQQWSILGNNGLAQNRRRRELQGRRDVHCRNCRQPHTETGYRWNPVKHPIFCGFRM